MSENILKALMQLFAIIAKVENEHSPKNIMELLTSYPNDFKADTEIVAAFLRSELNTQNVTKYLDLFQEYAVLQNNTKAKKDSSIKRTSLNSVKVLRICSQINKELTQRQKFIVLIRLIEFIQSTGRNEQKETDFISTVSEMFNINTEEYKLLLNYLYDNEKTNLNFSNILFIDQQIEDLTLAKQLEVEGIDKEIRIIQIKSINTLFFRYLGSDELYMNGQIIANRTHVLNQGTRIRTGKITPIYYSDIISNFINDKSFDKITLKVNNLSYTFKNSENGLNPLSFTEESGTLVGIMGSSGSGKSTLLNLLNGNLKPKEGSIEINGINLNTEKKKLDGIIGYISQDDLLIEELTVYENLFYNTQLCFNKLSSEYVHKKVLETLSSFGLLEIQSQRVGGVLDQGISGGQRKRLNIALELIREPSILFIDEPTSGLSSSDSENIIDLLKELTLKGKLIFIVIHQPSSDIYKKLDKVIILDQGGYLIYEGNPVDALVYFKTTIDHVNADERECYNCGHVNTEQLFNIIEAKIVDEFGKITATRKINPKEWNRYYNRIEKTKKLDVSLDPLTKKEIQKNKFKQFRIYFKRDLLSKLANRQYLLINLVEAPILAIILSFFVKFYKNEKELHYSFYENVNIPQYIFISVIVALFIGLTVSVEEIHKDKKILYREKFINLSRLSYLFSKTSLLFLLSAIQSLLFVLIGNYILEIHGLYFEYWLVLFSISCLANIIGLNISSAFSSDKVIYIVVPLIIIPQLLFSGVIVRFDKLNPTFSKKNEVPWLGNIMAARWAYEALAVTQSTNNEFEKLFFEADKLRHEASWKKDYWIPEMKNLCLKIIDKNSSKEEFEDTKTTLLNELENENQLWTNFNCNHLISDIQSINFLSDYKEIKIETDNYLNILDKQYTKNKVEITKEIEVSILSLGEEKYQILRTNFDNRKLSELVTNKMEVDKILLINNRLVRMDNPVFDVPYKVDFLKSHFYSPSKYIFGKKVKTFSANIVVLWCMSFILFITLYYDSLKKSIQLFSITPRNKKHKKRL